MPECSEMENNLDYCSCTYEPCPRKGNCCACIQYHNNKGVVPGCLFDEKAEKTYNRSRKYFLQTQS